jgi:hypothetical protein
VIILFMSNVRSDPNYMLSGTNRRGFAAGRNDG